METLFIFSKSVRITDNMHMVFKVTQLTTRVHEWTVSLSNSVDIMSELLNVSMFVNVETTKNHWTNHFGSQIQRKFMQFDIRKKSS